MSPLVRLSMRLNPLFDALLRSRLHWLVSPGLMLLTVTGRRSGRQYTIPVGYHRMRDAVIVLVDEAPSKTWWRNYLDGGPVEIRLSGRLLKGRAQTLAPESDEFRRRAEASFARSSLIPRMFGIAFDAQAGLSRAQLEQLAQRVAIVRIVPTQPF